MCRTFATDAPHTCEAAIVVVQAPYVCCNAKLTMERCARCKIRYLSEPVVEIDYTQGGSPLIIRNLTRSRSCHTE